MAILAGQKIGLTVTLLLAQAEPASPHCYSRWFYPSPQHCGAGGPRVRVAVARVPVREGDPLPSPRPVEPQEQSDIPMIPMILPSLDPVTPIDPPSAEQDEILHAIAVERLKEEMRTR